MLADRSSESYTGLLAMAKEFRAGVDGILVNTFRDLEPAVGDGLEGLEVPVHPVGPLVMTRPARVDQDHESKVVGPTATSIGGLRVVWQRWHAYVAANS